MFFKSGDGFSFSYARLVFLSKTMCTISTKNRLCRFLFRDWNIKQVKAALAICTGVETKIFCGWKVNTLFVWARWTKHISNNLLNWVCPLFKNVRPLMKLQRKRNFLLLKRNIAHPPGTWTSIEYTDNQIFQEIEKSSCVRRVYQDTFPSDRTRSQEV